MHVGSAVSSPASTIGNVRPVSATSVTTTAVPDPGSKADFSTMTSAQLIDQMNALIKSGKMTLDRSSALVGLARTPLSKATPDAAPMDAPFNVLTYLANGIQGSLSRGDTASAKRITDVLGIIGTA